MKIAIILFGLALAGCGESAESAYAKAASFEGQGQYADAMDGYRLILEKSPSSPEAAKAKAAIESIKAKTKADAIAVNCVGIYQIDHGGKWPETLDTALSACSPQTLPMARHLYYFPPRTPSGDLVIQWK